MLNIPEEVKALFRQDGVRKNFRVHFPNGERADLVNKDIIEQSVKFTESTCSQQNLRFGLTELSTIEFECVGVENIAGAEIECGIEVDVSSLGAAWVETNGETSPDVPFSFYAVPYGVFVVDKCPRQADMKRRKVTGYTPFDAEDINGFRGYRRGGMTFKPELLLAQLTKTRSDYIGPKRVEDAPSMAVGQNSTTALSSLRFLSLRGVDFRELYMFDVEDPDDYTPITDGQLIRVNYTRDTLDDYTGKLYKIARAVMPSGNYYYAGGTSPYQVYASMTVAPAVALGCLLPHIAINLIYSNGRTYPCYPILLTGPGVYAINPADFVRAQGSVGTPVGYTCTVRVPVRWHSTAAWEVVNAAGGVVSSTAITAWPIDAYQGQRRAGEVSASILSGGITQGQTGECTAKKSTAVNLPGLGAYAAYDNTVNITGAANGLLEARGLFGNFQRDGTVRLEALSRSTEEAVPLGLEESVWAEEFIVGPYGSVLYNYVDGSEVYEDIFYFDDTAPGVYDLTGNGYFDILTDRSQAAIETLLSEHFVPNVTGVAYAPIDAVVKGLPWVEDGDAIKLETKDGEVESFVLRRTLSGVQHLTDDLEAEGVEA